MENILTWLEGIPLQDEELDESDDLLSTLGLLDSIRENIRQLEKNNVLKSGVYSYVIDIIMEDADIHNQVRTPL